MNLFQIYSSIRSIYIISISHATNKSVMRYGRRANRDRSMEMSAPTALRTPSDLETNAAHSVAAALNVALADSYAIFLKTKNFHWHVSGPHFRDYHLLLDEQATQIFAVTDAIAERVRKIGGTTLRSIGHVGRLQRVSDNDSEFVRPEDMLRELHRDNLALVEDFREVKRLAEAAGDNATSGVVDDWTDQAEERAWFLFEASRGS
jgi:starvation-inducible DNA-binding protein